jgi:hypothetical protein
MIGNPEHMARKRAFMEILVKNKTTGVDLRFIREQLKRKPVTTRVYKDYSEYEKARRGEL